ncbi:MAG: sulfite exporter TauE/SafE family protein [Verrucomicrobiota bacterium]
METLSWIYLPTAFVLGMLHALEPGHSKTVMASYLISIKGKASDALWLGLTITLTHTIVIFLLALGVLVAHDFFPLEKIQHSLELVSAILVFLMGGWLLQSRIHGWRHARDHERGIEHNHHHSHHHVPLPATGERLSAKQLISFGMAGGLIPCPPALAIFVLSVGTGQATLGVITVVIFSLGLALTLVGIGIAVCKGIDLFQSKLGIEKWSQWLPILSSALVTLLGLLMLFHAIRAY